MHICVISPDYPDDKKTNFFFVKNLVDAWTEIPDVKISVIAPFSITHNKRLCSFIEKKKLPNGKDVTIYRPNYFSFSNLKIFGIGLTKLFLQRPIFYALKRLSEEIDVIYGHFWNSAYNAYAFAVKNNIPLFVATGESEIAKQFHVTDEKKLKEFSEYVKGVVCVSSKNKLESIDLKLTEESKCEVIPNAINNSIFKKLDKAECRKKLNIRKDKFIVAFTGWFIERKGSNRLSDALSKLDNENIEAIFIGDGPDIPNYRNIIFKGKLNHDEIPTYLNAADVFVLPTLKEGCCNAIIEAMACGLPIISSDRDFNHDVLDQGNAILINPMDVNEIASAIDCLYKDSRKLYEMSQNSLKKAFSLNINSRAEKINDFILSRINQK